MNGSPTRAINGSRRNMATKTIDQLTGALAALLTQEFEIYDPAGSPKSKKITCAQLEALLATPDFNSGPVTISSAIIKTIVIPHGLGAIPRRIEVYLQNLNASDGYSIGDLITLESLCDPNDATVPAIALDGTNITLIFFNEIGNYYAAFKDGSNTANIDGINWAAIAYAWK